VSNSCHVICKKEIMWKTSTMSSDRAGWKAVFFGLAGSKGLQGQSAQRGQPTAMTPTLQQGCITLTEGLSLTVRNLKDA
jgi:hypothetical protein